MLRYLLTLCVVLTSCTQQEPCESGFWEVNGRRVRVDTRVKSAARVIVLFHGNGDDADGFCEVSGLCRAGAERGFVVLTPEGKLRNVGGNDLSWNPYDATSEDFVLFDQVVSRATKVCGVQDVVVAGYSQGGFMAFALGETRDLAGAIVMAAGAPAGPTSSGTSRTPFLFAFGENDAFVGLAKDSADALLRRGRSVQVVEIASAEHGRYLEGGTNIVLEFATTAKR